MTKYGLHPHLTIMVIETLEMLNETVNTVKIMFKMQVTICTPIDFTPFIETIENKLLLVDDYNDFDMSRVIKHSINTTMMQLKFIDSISSRFV